MPLALATFLAKTPYEIVGLVIRVKNESQTDLPSELELTIPATRDELREFLNL